MKIVSHCYIDSHYTTPGDDRVGYPQLQVVTEDGRVFARILYWKDRYDANITIEWQEVDVDHPPLPRNISLRQHCEDMAHQLRQIVHEGYVDKGCPRGKRILKLLRRKI
jgi:hypothetical protein